ncbi:membrane progestin receptor beta-like [Chanos chanos]|uniref:Membrane progestin receptor beta-like n=1 Tax=Chanos chanos TaxID=29144 RepID=A0A6J2WKE8_CHACN|nr:membrane progestin receptor beta-like [Chanos chanos]
MACLSALLLPSKRAGPVLSLSSLPGTVQDCDVPILFREPYIRSGYRQVGHGWRFYLLSLFQWHNESLNVWSHMLAGLAVALRFWVFSWEVSLCVCLPSLPLFLYILSTLTYLACSTTAHLLQSHSELAHYSLFFLDYVGVSVYQYGCAIALYFYSSELEWRESKVGKVFLPCAALLAWLTCTCCCFAKLHYRRPYPLRRKMCQLMPTSLAYLLVISPVAHRLATSSWSDPALSLHVLQVFFFLLAAIFFSCPVPECFFPGSCDIVGHGHQVFHVFIALCTLVQLEALFKDYLARRQTLLQEHGEIQLLLACASFPTLVLCSMLTAATMRRQAQVKLEARPR